MSPCCMSFTVSDTKELSERLAVGMDATDKYLSPLGGASLPADVLLVIFHHLDFDDKLRAERTCRLWHRLLLSPQVGH